MKTEDKVMIGQRMAQLRKSQNHTQKQLGDVAELPWRTYQAYEVGFREVPASALKQLAEKLNWNPAWILLGDGDPILRNDHQLIRDCILRVENRIAYLGRTMCVQKKADLINLVLERSRTSGEMPDHELDNCINMGAE